MSNSIFRVVWLILVCSLTGCFSTSVKWYKPGATAASFSSDKDACQSVLLGTGESNMPKQVYTFEACMERKGWQQVPASAQ